MISIRARIAGSMVKAFKVFYRYNTPVKLQRAFYEISSALLLAPKGVDFEPLKAGNVKAAWLVPENPDSGRVILYLHGGGYVIGSIRAYRKMTGHLANAAGCKVLLIEYRLAPEHEFPAAIEDAVSSYRGLLSQGYKPENIVIAGDSSGGGLAAATLVSLRDSGDPMPAAAIMASPWIDLEMTGESIRTMAKKDPMLTLQEVKRWSAQYLGDTDPKNPLASPIYADLKGLPPLLIHAGTREILLDDAKRFAERARDDGVEVQLDIYDGMWHVYQSFCGLVPESTEAVKKLGSFCRDKMGSQEVRTDVESHLYVKEPDDVCR